jgi:D-beta-D-heptose 7-phosphate kinase/D-beta-D-heptose 1-phosphate adenosyltransferase
MTDQPRWLGSNSKIVSLAEAKRRVEEWRREGKSVAYTNGCFDVIHAGHVRTLEAARRHGDVLVVGINGDDSARRLKGPGRPVMPEGERAELLAALSCVDLVVIFPELSSLPTIEALRPDVWVKGGDYTLDTVNQQERAFVESYGGRVALGERVAEVSTTELIKRIKRLPG